MCAICLLPMAKLEKQRSLHHSKLHVWLQAQLHPKTLPYLLPSHPFHSSCSWYRTWPKSFGGKELQLPFLERLHWLLSSPLSIQSPPTPLVLSEKDLSPHQHLYYLFSIMGLDRGPASSFELCCTLAIIPMHPCFWPSHPVWSQSLLISLTRAARADSQMEQWLGASLANISWNLCRQNEMLPCRLPEFFSFPAWIFIRSHDSPLNISLSALLQRTPYGRGNSPTERDNMEEMVHGGLPI